MYLLADLFNTFASTYLTLASVRPAVGQWCQKNTTVFRFFISSRDIVTIFQRDLSRPESAISFISNFVVVCSVFLYVYSVYVYVV